jgi:hypothetical protein
MDNTDALIEQGDATVIRRPQRTWRSKINGRKITSNELKKSRRRKSVDVLEEKPDEYVRSVVTELEHTASVLPSCSFFERNRYCDTTCN